MSNVRPRGYIHRGNVNRGRGFRGATAGSGSERGRGPGVDHRGTDSVRSGSNGGRRGGFLPRGGGGQPGKPVSKKWCVLVMNKSATEEEIADFLLGLKYKLQQSNACFVLSADKQITLRPSNVNDAELSLYREKTNGDGLEFCLVLLAPTDKKTEIDEQLERTNIPRIFVKNFGDDSICRAAKEIKEVKSQGNGIGVLQLEPSREDEVLTTRPMNERKIHDMATDLTLSNEEILMKLTGDGSFAKRLLIPSKHLDTVDVLALISRASSCNASHYRRSLNELLESLCASNFWNSTLSAELAKVQFYNSLEIQRNQYAIRKLLLYTISIMVEILRSLESKAKDTLVIKSILSIVLNMPACRSNVVIFDDELLRHESSLNTLWHDVVEIKGVSALRSTSAANKYDDSDKPPPNSFRDLTIFPSDEEILTVEPPYLRPNKIRGAYDSIEHYLDVQFRLLREDYIDPLRKGINSVLSVKDNNKRPEIKVYEKVKIAPPVQNKRTGFLTYTLSFDVSNMKRVRWEISKRFLHGSLVCLSSNNFKTMLFATIDDRKPEDLKKGNLNVVFELLPDNRLSYKDEYRMVESAAYFEAYRHVLLALLAIKDERHMPFPKYFIQCDPNVDSPLYLRAINSELDLTCLIPKELPVKYKYLSNILRPDTWPSKEVLGLDESQYGALKLSLTKELAIIQGPPGTGKTFIGWKIAQVLLNNYERWQGATNTPILVVCYTNHALDQFLEGITSFTTEKIIRIGGRCKNEKLEKYLLKNVKSEYDTPRDLRFRLHQEYTKKSSIERRIALTSHLMQSLDKAPLNYIALSDIVKNNRILDQIVSNPNKLSVNKDRLLNIWLTSDKQIQKERMPVDLNALRDLMAFSQFDQVPCMNALFWAKGDSERAHMLLLQYARSPLLCNRIPEVANIPSIFDVDEIMATNQFSEQDAVFALQQNQQDVRLAINWLRDGYVNVQNEQFDELALQKAAAKEVVAIEEVVVAIDADDDDDDLFANDLDDENRQLDDDDGDPMETNNDYYYEEDFKPMEAIQDWNVVSKGFKSQFPQRVWDLIVRAKPYSDAEYRMINDNSRVVDPWKLSMNDRWRLYRTWLEMFRTEKDNEIRRYQKDYFDINQQMKEIRSLEQRHVFQQAKVLGMTTTGAARYQAVLNTVKPKIVIIEEAAEVLESHIVTSLSAGCQHVILIGDHFQLRPSPAVFLLAQKYQFDVSLFERLINNNFEHAVLKQQHRMRTEIADSLMPYFYDGLINHESVNNYDSVKGVNKNLYFYHHTHPEKQEGDSTSRQNEFEAKMIVGMCKYFLQQGYEPQKITVLCCYAGQMFCIKKLMKTHLLEEETKGLRVTVVDNYQGEECEIILLSFVRSNNEGKIGFLKTKNRVCVALSRAKIGLYCFGNFDLLTKCAPELWGEIVETVKNQSMYGQYLPLTCQIHKNDAAIKVFEDFQRLVPEGGCRELCNFRLDCGHVCQKFCHPNDTEHKKGRCTKPCQRSCPSGHPCKKLCFAECGDCMVQVEKVIPSCKHANKTQCYKPLDDIRCQLPCERYLACGHKCQETCDLLIHTKNCKIQVKKNLPCGHQIQSACYQSAEDVKCTAKVRKMWPFCQHSAETLCSIDVTKEQCKQPCGTTLECGHVCTGNCFTCRNGRLHVQCKETCTKILVCGHECGEVCSMSCPPCTKLCEIRCVHSSCIIQFAKNDKNKKQKGNGRKCGVPCPECQESCIWKCPHFNCNKKCFELCDRPRCNEKCPLKLTCGHQCIGVCGEKCPKICRVCHPDKFAELKEIFFGSEDEDDAKFLQLSDCEHIFEVVGFDNYIDNYLKQTQNSTQSEIKLLNCPKCRKVIQTSLRYTNAFKEIFADVQNIKRKIQGDLEQMDGRRKKLIEEISEKVERVHIADKDNAEFAFRELFKHFNDYLKNNKIHELTSEKLARMTNMINFLSRLVKLHMRIDQKFHNENFSPNTGFGDHPALSHVFVIEASSSILLNFLQFWFKPCLKEQPFFQCLSDEMINVYLSNASSKLLRWIADSYRNASKQMMDEFICELHRFAVLIEILVVLRTAVERKSEITDISDVEKIMQILNGSAKIDDPQEKKCLELLKSFLKKFNLNPSLGVTEKERKDIVKAMNMQQGHWFKCKNGHIYCITECGGAMQEAKCPECNETIGGTNHRLQAGNRLASEMDGASRGAYEAAAMDIDLNMLRRMQLDDD